MDTANMANEPYSQRGVRRRAIIAQCQRMTIAVIVMGFIVFGITVFALCMVEFTDQRSFDTSLALPLIGMIVTIGGFIITVCVFLIAGLNKHYDAKIAELATKNTYP